MSVVWLVLSAYLPAPSSAQPADGRGAPALPGSPDPAVRTANKAAPGLTQEARPDLAVEGRDVSGDVGRPIPLKVTIRQTGDVTVEGVRLLGLPPGFIVSDQIHIFKAIDREDIVDLTDWSLADLRITQPEKPVATFRLALSVIWKARHSESIEVSSAEFAVRTVARTGSIDRPAPDLIGADARAPEPTLPDPGSVAPLRRAPAPSALPGPALPTPALPGPAQPGADRTARPGPMAGAEPDRERVAARAPGPAETRSIAPLPSVTAPSRPIEAGGLVERAKALIKRGDISGARLFLERARARNEPEATFLLAQTWDPDVLQRWNVLGLRPDPERARALYAEAAERSRSNDQSLSTMRR